MDANDREERIIVTREADLCYRQEMAEMAFEENLAETSSTGINGAVQDKDVNIPE